jgi:hypothetical protein
LSRAELERARIQIHHRLAALWKWLREDADRRVSETRE